MPVKPRIHRPSRAYSASDHRQAADKQRGSSSVRGYDWHWRKAAKRFLAKHPLCAKCLERGAVVAATDVDHIVPHRGDHALFWDETNWQSLCHQDHSAKTAQEDGGFGNVARQSRCK